jgi:PAS domain S-box-containing protein
MSRPPASAVTRYGYAVILVALAVAGRLALDPVLGDRFPFATLFFAILIVAGHVGFGPALLATVLGALASARFLLPPRGRFVVERAENQAGMVLFVTISLGIALLGGALRAARRRAEERAAEALGKEERFRVTLASIGDAVIATDDRGRVILMNPVAERLTGWSQAEAAGRPLGGIFRIVNEKTREPVEDPTSRALREGVVVGLANHSVLLGKDGVERPIDDSAAPIRDDGGRVRGAVLVFRDVAGRRRDEEEIRRLNRQLQERVGELETLLDILPVGVWQGDPACERIIGNRMAYEMLGLPQGLNASVTALEVRAGRSPGFRCVLDGREVPPEELPMQRAARTGQSVLNYEHDVVFDDGRVKSLYCNVAPVVGGDGRVRSVIGAYADITDRKRAEADARKAQEIFKLVHGIGRIGHWEWNSLTDENKWSPEIQALYGLEPGTFEGTYDAWAKLIHPDDLPRAAEEVRRALETGRYFTEFRVIWPDGSVHWLEARAHVFKDGHDKPVRIMGVNMDITERKRIEDALKEADRRKDEFLATLAHELRNPLAPIRSAVEVFKAKGPPDPDLTWSRDVIDRQVGQMARLLDDLLDVSRITRDKLELRKRRVRLAEVVEAAVETSRPIIDGGGHELAVTLPPEPVHLDADPVRLAQVFANLLNNAAKYTDGGGRIRLAAEVVGHEVAVSVKDSGIGIAPEVLPHLFEIFSQAAPALERSQGGLGIGLSLTKGLVELHGGSIGARSDGPGRGSEFIVRLPVAAAPAVGEPHTPEVDGRCRAGSRIVVADDNRDAADSLAMLLRIAGNEVRTAYDGRRAVEEAEAFRPDVALLDIGMPGLNGYEAARRIRGQSWGREMMLVALTGWGQEEDKRRAADAGFNAHLVKPVDPAALERLLGTVVPRRG